MKLYDENGQREEGYCQQEINHRLLKREIVIPNSSICAICFFTILPTSKGRMKWKCDMWMNKTKVVKRMVKMHMNIMSRSLEIEGGSRGKRPIVVAVVEAARMVHKHTSAVI